VLKLGIPDVLVILLSITFGRMGIYQIVAMEMPDIIMIASFISRSGVNFSSVRVYLFLNLENRYFDNQYMRMGAIM